MSGFRDEDRKYAKTNAFIKECVMFGSLKGFKHFSIFLRGREEMLVTVTQDKSAPREQQETDDVESSSDIVFLLAVYARYQCPYAWVRSSHTRLPCGVSVASKDCHLKLRSVERWANETIHIWDVLYELIQLAFPSPVPNPFQLDYSLIETVPSPLELYLLTGALANFIRKLYLDGIQPTQQLFHDLQWTLDHHFKAAAYLPAPSQSK